MKLGFHGFIASTVSRLEPSKCCCFVSLSVRGKLYSKEYRLGLYDVIIKGNIIPALLVFEQTGAGAVAVSVIDSLSWMRRSLISTPRLYQCCVE
ncbi:hypothetical protein PISMIDRAFT_679369, partial [Pisolithus microcarpus 441]